jgi:tetratricopeptide (TPR) repeat protein
MNNDSLLSLTASSFRDSNSINKLLDASQSVMYDNVLKATQLSIKALDYSQKIEYANGKVYALSLLGEALTLRGDYSKGIETALSAVHEAGKTTDRWYLSLAYTKLGAAYQNFGDHREAIRYFRKERGILGTDEVILGLLGFSFTKMNMLDSALEYSQRAYQLDIQSGPDHWALPYLSLGEIHSKMKRYSMALEYYRTVLSLKVFKLDTIDAQIGIATVFNKLNQRDSALSYAYQAINKAKSNSYSYSDELASSYALVKDIYKEDNKLDSAFVYQELLIAVKDSTLASEKLNEIQNMKFNQQIKELEFEQSNREIIRNRKNNLQLGAIGIGLLSFIVLFFTLSTSIVVKERFVSFFGIVALLLVFEFVNLFVHPFIGDFTDHSPILMFLIMVCIAALLVPAHHRLEEWITHQLVEKNKRVRLASAKKTIEQLEGKK